jgi:hypothetical protein
MKQVLCIEEATNMFGFKNILSNNAMGKIKSTFGAIDGVLMTEGLRNARSNSGMAANLIASAASKEEAGAAFGGYMGALGIGIGSSALRGAGYGAAIGAAYGALDPNESVIGGAWGGAWKGAALTGGYGVARSLGGAMGAAKALKGFG